VPEAVDLLGSARPVRRLLIIPPAAGLGDLGPALTALRAALPRAAVHLFAGHNFTDFADPAPALLAVERLAAARLDLALIFTGEGETAFEAAYLAYLAGVPVRAGFADEFGGGVLSPALRPPPPGTSGPARHLSLLRGLGLGATRAAPAL
jgi:hypothetical protein